LQKLLDKYFKAIDAVYKVLEAKVDAESVAQTAVPGASAS
jgi:hypothetical protein